jgi:hypothetical protein
VYYADLKAALTVRYRRVTLFAHGHFALQFVAEIQQEGHVTLPRCSTGISAATRLPSGARSTVVIAVAIVMSASGLSDHGRGLSRANESPVAVYVATMIWLSSPRKNSSRPLRDQTGLPPLEFETCHFPPLSGNARTQTSYLPDSLDM